MAEAATFPVKRISRLAVRKHSVVLGSAEFRHLPEGTIEKGASDPGGVEATRNGTNDDTGLTTRYEVLLQGTKIGLNVLQVVLWALASNPRQPVYI